MKADNAFVRPDASTNTRWLAAMLGLACCGSIFILLADGNLANRLNPLLFRLIHAGLFASISAALYMCWPFVFRRADARGPPPDLNEPSSVRSGAAKRHETTAQVSDRWALSVEELQVLDRFPAMISVADPSGSHEYLNQRATDYFGGTAADFGDAGWMAAVHPDERLATVSACRQAASSGRPIGIHHRLKKWDGTYRWHHTRVEPEFNEQGVIVRWYGLSVDTPDQLVAVSELEAPERDLQSLVDAVPAMLVVTLPNGQVEYVNKTTLEAIGVGLDAFRNLDWMSIIHPDDAKDLANKWMTAVKEGVRFEAEYRQRCADGSYRWWVIKVLPSRSDTGEILRWYGAITDIDGLKRIEDALRLSERIYRVMLDAIPALIWRTDAGGVVDYANQRCVDFHGLTIDQQANGGWQSLVHPNDIELTEQRWLEALQTKQLFDTTYRFKRTDGVYRWMHVLASPLTADDGSIVSWYGIHIDVDDQKVAENALAESEHQLSLIIETIPAMVWRAAPDGELDYISRRCTENLGMLLEEMQQFGWLRSVHPDDVAVTLERWRYAETSGQVFAATYRFLFTDGFYRWMQVTAAPLRDKETGQILSWYGVHVNIDEQKRTENALRDSEQSLRQIMETSKAMEATLRSTQLQLARASQIATVAELSASIAHEINQPLAAVAANSHACVRWLAAEPPNLQRARFAAQSIVGDANSAAQVVERIRALFKRAAPQKAVLDINEVIQQVLLLMRDEILEKKVNATVELDPDVPPILADRVQIQQTLINLIHNATEAMENLTGRMKLITLSSRREGAEAIIVQIRDHGSGLEDVDRVFEPFFTTKDKGMGVGLSICRSIIEAHGGRLWAAANQGPGSTFAFTLPVQAEGIV
jgi:PAS domain S-box-containing protein